MRRRLIFIGIGLIILISSLVVILLKYNYIRIPKIGEVPAGTEMTVIKNYHTGSAEWNEAEAKWELFTSEHLERMRQIEAKTPRAKLSDYKFDREFMEIKSPLITKYISSYRIFTEKYFEFTLKKDGHIIGLGTTWPGKLPFQSAPDFELMDDSTFLNTAGVKVNDSKTAIEVVKLIWVLHSNGQSAGYESNDWVMKAQKKQNYWLITIDFVGPPSVSIGMPSSWKIFTNKQNQVETFKEIPPGGEPCDINGDWECNESDFKIFQGYFGECAEGGNFNVQADPDHDLCITIYDQAQLFPETLPIDYFFTKSTNKTLGTEGCKKECESMTRKQCSNILEACRQTTGEVSTKECMNYLQLNPEILNNYPCTYYSGHTIGDSTYCSFGCKK